MSTFTTSAFQLAIVLGVLTVVGFYAWAKLMPKKLTEAELTDRLRNRKAGDVLTCQLIDECCTERWLIKEEVFDRITKSGIIVDYRPLGGGKFRIWVLRKGRATF